MGFRRDDDEEPTHDDRDSDENELGGDDDGPLLQVEAEVICPYCGEKVEIALDPGGGEEQEYVEDCEVCCRPWQVHVSYGRGGRAQVWLEGEA